MLPSPWTSLDNLYALIARSYGIERMDPKTILALQLGAASGYLLSRTTEDYLLVPHYDTEVMRWIRSRDRSRVLRLYCDRGDLSWFGRAPNAVYRVYRMEGSPPEVISPSEIRFRTLASADLPEVERLYASDRQNPFLELDFDRTDLIARPHLAAFDGDRLVAITGTVFDMLHEFEVGRDFTHPEYRRRGIQKALVSTFLRSLRKAGDARKILAWIREENIGAQRLFESLGFERIGEFCSYTLQPDELRSS